MNSSPELRPSNSVALSVGLCLVLVGIALNLLSRSLDGFVQGLLIGAGLMTILLGVLVMRPLLRRGKGDDALAQDAQDDTWLPSRDGDR